MPQREGSARGGRLADVVRAAEDPSCSSVLLVGPPGSGKTFLLGRLAEQLAMGALSPGGAEPLEPVAWRPTRDVEDPTLRSVLPAPRQLAPDEVAAPGRRRPVVVDDVDLLGPSSLSLLSRGVDSGALWLAAAVRSRKAAELFRQLRPSECATVVRLTTWDAAALDSWTADSLGLTLHPLTVRRLLRFSGGNPLCLTEMVSAAQREGRLAPRHGCWVWTGDLEVPPITAARVDGELLGIDDDGRSAAEMVALSGGLPFDVLHAALGAAAVEAAEGAGVVSVGVSHGRRSVRPADVLEGRVLAQLTPTTRRLRLESALLKAVGRRPPDEEVAVAVARVAASAGEGAPHRFAATAARVALGAHDDALAERVVDGVVDPEARELLAEARIRRGQFAAAVRVLDDLLAHGGLPVTARDRVRTRRATAVLAAGGEPAGGAAPGSAECAAAGAWVGAGPVPPQSHRVLHVASLAQRGRVEAALERAGRPGPSDVLLLAVAGGCHLARGDLGSAGDVAARLRERGLVDGFSLAYRLGSLVAGRAALLAADTTRAAQHLTESAGCEVDAGRDALLGYTLWNLALVRAMQGRLDDEDLPPAPVAGNAAPQAVRDQAELVVAEVQHLSGQRHTALARALAVADRCEEAGQLLLALEALHLCVRIRPTAPLATRLAEVAGATDFRLADVHAAHAAAAVHHDGARLTQVAEEYERRGLRWLAGETAAKALAVAGSHPVRGAGWPAASRQVLDRLHAAGGVTVPEEWWQGSRPFDALTDREREIVQLAVAGWTSRRLAEHLQLSLRTVENHLQHSYRKLGVNGRQQLASVVGTGAVAFPSQPSRREPGATRDA